MRILTDATEVTRKGGALLARTGAIASVSGIAGTGFEAYARILHPARIDHPGDVIGVGDSTRCTWAQIADVTGRRIHPLVQWSGLVGGVSRRWDRFDACLPDGSRVTIDEGVFAPEDLAQLLSVLGPFTATRDELIAAIWNGWGNWCRADNAVDGRSAGSEASTTTPPRTCSGRPI